MAGMDYYIENYSVSKNAWGKWSLYDINGDMIREYSSRATAIKAANRAGGASILKKI